MQRRRSIPVTPFPSLAHNWDDETFHWRKLSFPEDLTAIDPKGFLQSQIEIEEQFLHFDETVVESVKSKAVDKFNLYKDLESQKSNVASIDHCVLELTSDMALDNCCSLDVVTIRNESVLANNSSLGKTRLESEGYETASSVESIAEETQVLSLRQLPGPINHNCPFCGECIDITTFGIVPAMKSENTFHDNQKLTSYVYTTEEEEECEPLLGVPTYYVQLRKNLYFPSNSLQLQPPKNFSVDQKGQLLIDYTASWQGLEKYIETLKNTL